MANNLQKKPFLDYQAQIKYLKHKQLRSVTMDLSTDTRIFSKTLLQTAFIPALPLMISIFVPVRY